MTGGGVVTEEALGDLTGFRGGEGTPLVLLHGFMGTWRVWKPLLDTLTAEHRVFAPTLPGHFGAAPLADGFAGSIGALADLLEAQMDEEGIEKAHIAGNSLGGWLSLELGRRGRALSVVAFSPAGAWRSDRDLKRVIRLMRVARTMSVKAGARLQPHLHRDGVRKLALRSVAVHGDRVPAEEVAAGLEEVLGCAVFEPFLNWVAGEQSFPAAARPADYPIRIAWSEKDRTISLRRYGRPMHAAVPEAEFLVLPGVGHVPMFDDPAMVAQTILEVTRAA